MTDDTTQTELLQRTPEDVFRTIEEGLFYEDYDQSVSDLGILRKYLTSQPTGVAAAAALQMAAEHL